MTREIAWLGFGLVTAGAALWLGPSLAPGLSYLDRLAFASSFAGLWTALGWLAALGVMRSTPWAITWGLLLLVPYLNLVLASVYARHYWSDGAREPALLGLAAGGLQTLVALRLLEPGLPTLV